MNDLVSKLAGQRLLVVGDVMLDEYISGSFLGGARDSRLAVVLRREHRQAPGGAANVAANAGGLGAKVVLAGVIGADEPGKRLCRELTARGIDGEGVLIDSSRPTTSKTTVVSTDLRYRLDHESRAPLADDLQERLWRFIEERLPSVAACVLSDYAKGVVSASLAARLIRRGRELGVPVVVDPKGAEWDKYRGATLVKPNDEEVSVALGRSVGSNEDAAAVGSLLVERLGSAVLLSRAARGMTLCQRGSAALHLPALTACVRDETGAGDTVVATVAVALAAGASLERACVLSSRAAAVVVGFPGTTAVRVHDLTTAPASTPAEPSLDAQDLIRLPEDGQHETLTLSWSDGSGSVRERGIHEAESRGQDEREAG